MKLQQSALSEEKIFDTPMVFTSSFNLHECTKPNDQDNQVLGEN